MAKTSEEIDVIEKLREGAEGIGVSSMAIDQGRVVYITRELCENLIEAMNVDGRDFSLIIIANSQEDKAKLESALRVTVN